MSKIDICFKILFPFVYYKDENCSRLRLDFKVVNNNRWFSLKLPLRKTKEACFRANWIKMWFEEKIN